MQVNKVRSRCTWLLMMIVSLNINYQVCVQNATAGWRCGGLWWLRKNRNWFPLLVTQPLSKFSHRVAKLFISELTFEHNNVINIHIIFFNKYVFSISFIISQRKTFQLIQIWRIKENKKRWARRQSWEFMLLKTFAGPATSNKDL